MATTESAFRARAFRARAKHSSTVWALRLLLLLIVVGAWLYGTGPGEISFLILPPLGEVFSAIGGLVTTQVFWTALGVTVFEMLVAFLLAAVVGVSLGFFLSRTPLRAQASEPLLSWGYMFPVVLLYPLFLLWVGVGIGSKIAYAATAAFFPIAYNTLRGLRSVDEKYLKVGVAFGASRLATDRHIKAGAARPMILSGLRIGVSVVMISVVLAELLGSNAGLGYELQRAASTLRLPDEYGIALLLLVVAVTLQRVLELALRPRRPGQKAPSRATEPAAQLDE
ncbi:ABC transporter permease [Blastococcus saxobsidens]|uniref:NitT/TauT family transport system permease protein n=1 Tax=Blastococcus saxobsidens TaxID=138336 RepID=A0A4Q7Y371_9ACTN|nr:ABC transporter permease [Blastococcus saxobsidens]RZU30978.1 NitT/TauT family transport system permease protein [Blastococcus saxobsidens]